MLALCLALAPLPLPAAEPSETCVCTGVARRQDNGRVHTTSREVQRWSGGRVVSATTTWTDGAGKVIARQSERYGDAGFVPDAHFEDLRSGLRMECGPAPGGKARLAFREQKDAEIERKIVAPEGKAVGLGALDGFIRANWTDIDSGKPVEFAMLAPSRLDWYRFRLRRLGETQHDGHRVVRLAVEPRNAVIRTLAGDLVLTFDPLSGHGIAFSGRDLVEDADGDAVRVNAVYRCTTAAAPEPTAPN